MSSTFSPQRKIVPITQHASQSFQTNVNLMWQRIVYKELQMNSHIWAKQNSHYSWSITNSGGKRLKHYFSVKSICDGDLWLPNIKEQLVTKTRTAKKEIRILKLKNVSDTKTGKPGTFRAWREWTPSSKCLFYDLTAESLCICGS